MILKMNVLRMAFLDYLQNTGTICSMSRKGTILYDLKDLDMIEMVRVRVTFYLFNYTRRSLHGVFKSIEAAHWKLKPSGMLQISNDMCGKRSVCVVRMESRIPCRNGVSCPDTGGEGGYVSLSYRGGIPTHPRKKE